MRKRKQHSIPSFRLGDFFKRDSTQWRQILVEFVIVVVFIIIIHMLTVFSVNLDHGNWPISDRECAASKFYIYYIVQLEISTQNSSKNLIMSECRPPYTGKWMPLWCDRWCDSIFMPKLLQIYSIMLFVLAQSLLPMRRSMHCIFQDALSGFLYCSFLVYTWQLLSSGEQVSDDGIESVQ